MACILWAVELPAPCELWLNRHPLPLRQYSPTKGRVHRILEGSLIHARERSGATHPQRLLNRTNHAIGPLFHLDAAGTLSITERMAKRLDAAQMGHIGKNINILTQDEHYNKY
eukprot:scaffold10166_cov146-Isochrysis_galbana.AAC.2